MFKNKALASIFLVVFIDLLGFSLILPLLPYLAKTFHASDFEVGLLVAVYAAASLIGAPILGRLSDRYGRRPLLLVSIFGTFIGFLVLAFAQNIWVLFLERLIDGITAGNISIAQAYISDVTDPKDRSKAFGMIGAAFGLGFIIGPAVGGALSTFGYIVPALVAASLTVINLVLVAVWLRESLTPEKRAELSASGSKPPAFTIGAMFAALRRPLVGPLLHTRFIFGLAFSLFQSIFSLYALERFQLNVQSIGFVLAYVGVLSVITQGFMIGKLTARYSEARLIVFSTGLMAIGLAGWALAPSLWVLLLVMAPTAFAGGVLNTVINSAISKSVAPAEIGGMLGLSASLESATRVIAPSLGGLLLDQVGRSYGIFAGTAAPGIFSTLVMIWLFSYVVRRVKELPTAPANQSYPGSSPAAAQAQAGD
jgi:DHA1 family tetracycline resistance protein-like MFS transporter